MRIYNDYISSKLLTYNNNLKKDKLEACKRLTKKVKSLYICKIQENFTNVSFSFSSFEQDDLFLSFKLYNNYIAKVTNILNISKIPTNNILINIKSNYKKSNNYNNVITLKALKIQENLSYLRTVRAINNYNNHYYNNGYNSLYTVIKSPHVYKKTREQFALSHYKASVNYKIKHNTTTSLLKNTFLALKFPVEIKMVFKALY